MDAKEIGKNYLRELPTINQNSRIQKSRSTNTLVEADNNYKSRYIDYLQDLKTQRTTKTSKTDE